MSAIATTANSSAYSAVALLLSNDASSATTQVLNSTTSGAAASSASSAPVDSVNLSDYAKATLARAQTDQVAADTLQAFLQSARNSNGSGTTSPQPTANDVTQRFDQLTGQTQSQQGGTAPSSLADFQLAGGGANAGLANYSVALANANRKPDGTVQSYSQNFSDVVAVPSTQQEIAAWYQNDGKAVLGAAQYNPADYPPGLAEAITSHSVSFLNANDIPDLNFHNTITIQGGETGGSGGEVYTYDHNAAIFSDPATSYQVLADGTVLSWKTPPATATTASA
jgi:hypothetical protein